MEKICGDVDLFWYVGERDKYPCKTIQAGNLMKARNKALDDSFDDGESCLMLDDDLVKIYIAAIDAENQKVKFQITFADMVDIMADRLESTNLKMAGILPTSNLYFVPKAGIGLKHFCIASCIMVKPNPLRFDTRLKTKEDYDYTLQHIKKYGGVCRINSLMPQFLHYSNQGGCQTFRSLAVEKQSVQYLKKKWGTKTIRDNPRREGEILLQVK